MSVLFGINSSFEPPGVKRVDGFVGKCPSGLLVFFGGDAAYTTGGSALEESLPLPQFASRGSRNFRFASFRER